MGTTLLQFLSVVGAFMVLAAYAASQYGAMRSDGVVHGLLNLLGSTFLASSAFAPFNAGVLIVELSWALLSLGITLRALQRRRLTAPASIPLKP